LSVESTFFFVEFIIIIRVHFEIVESKFGFDLYVSQNCTRIYPLFEGLTLGKGEGV